jgi:flagellar basal-body rod protein FlgB
VTLIDTTQSALELAMHGATMRHEALAANIANADTPGYQARDIDFHSTLQDALSAGPTASAAGDFAVRAEPATMRADGNGVDIDVETSKLAENTLEYEALTTVARARLDIIGSAMGVR